MHVTTRHLQMLAPPSHHASPLPEGVRLERATGMTPEYARFLYALVGGDWFWLDRLPWSQQQWLDEIETPGSEFLVLYREGVPAGFVQLHPTIEEDGTHIEVLHFGLAPQAIGMGLGRGMLEHAIDRAWSLSERFELPPVARVWLHTCSNDGPAALANYTARGFEVFKVVESEEDAPATSPGAWAILGGR